MVWDEVLTVFIQPMTPPVVGFYQLEKAEIVCKAVAG